MRVAAAVVASLLATPACSQPPAPARTQMAPPVSLSREVPRREIPVPAGLAPKTLAVRLDPVAGGPGFGVEVWLLRPGAERLRLGAAAPFPVGEPGEFLIPWPAGLKAPPGSRLLVELAPASAEGRPAATVSVAFR